MRHAQMAKSWRLRLPRVDFRGDRRAEEAGEDPNWLKKFAARQKLKSRNPKMVDHVARHARQWPRIAHRAPARAIRRQAWRRSPIRLSR
jgi:hypothetical protein